MREAGIHSHRLSIALRYLATDDNFKELKFVRATSQSTGIVLLETCLLLDRQTAAE
jgi:hypothetical protein